MSRSAAVVSGVRWTPRDGGPIGVHQDGSAIAVERLRETSEGVEFGPLRLSAPAIADATVVFSDLSLPLPGTYKGGLFGWLPLATGAVAGSLPASETQRPLGRRRLLQATAGALTLSLLAGRASAADTDREDLYVMDGRIDHNPRGLRIQIADDVPDILPPVGEYVVTLDGARYDSFQAPHGDAYLPEGATGDLRVSVPDYEAWGAEARQWLVDRTVHLPFDLPRPADTYDRGDTIELSDDAFVTGLVHEHGPDEMVVTIDGDHVPHPAELSDRDRLTAQPGRYYLDNGPNGRRLLFEVGAAAPSASRLVVAGPVGRMAEFWDDRHF